MPIFRICYRKDTAENWEKNNPILLEGEVGYEVDDKGAIKSKMGDGYLASDGKIHGTPWNDLPYVSGPPGPPPEHKWEGGTLLFQNPDGTWDEGRSLTGPKPAHRWLGTALQWETPSGAWGDAVDLQGAPGNASLLPATTTRLGGIIVGDGLTINENGCVSTTPVSAATTAKAGIVQPDGVTTFVSPDGILRAATPYNTRLVITSSNSAWTPPVTGWARVTVIGGGGAGGDGGRGSGSTTSSYGGGQGGTSSFGSISAIGGSGGGAGGLRGQSGACGGGGGGGSGKVIQDFVYLSTASPIKIVIGAGGLPSVGTTLSSPTSDGLGCSGVGPDAGYGGRLRCPGGGAAGAGNGSSGATNSSTFGGNGGNGGSNGYGYGGGGGGGGGGSENNTTGQNGFGGRGADNGSDGQYGNRGYYGPGGAGGPGAVIIEYYDPNTESA